MNDYFAIKCLKFAAKGDPPLDQEILKELGFDIHFTPLSRIVDFLDPHSIFLLARFRLMGQINDTA